jgi:hypothetical protein
MAAAGHPARSGRGCRAPIKRPRTRHGARPYPAAPYRLGPMTLALPIVWSDRHRRHDPGGDVWIGARTSGSEGPRRAAGARAALERRGGSFVGHPGDTAEIRPARGLPTVLVPQRGCDLTTIGPLACVTLAGVQEGPARA